MHRSQRKIVAWLVLTVMSFNPLLVVLALDTASHPAMVSCGIVLAASSDITQSTGAEAEMGCAQHHACMSNCQFAPLQPTSSLQMQVSQLLWLAIPDEAENFNTRFLESIERPPRV